MEALQIGISWATSGAGGSGRIVADLVKTLPDHGVDVVGAVSAPVNASQLTGGRIQCFSSPGDGMVKRLKAARRLIQLILVQQSPALIASHFALYTLPVLDELGKRPFVMHFHGPWAAESRQEGGRSLVVYAKRQLECLVYRKANLVIVLSNAFAEVAALDYGVSRTKIRVVPGAVDASRFAIEQTRAECRRALGWPEGKRIFVAVRRLVSRMGLDRLIAAMKTVVENYPDTLLYIAGKGRLRVELEAQVASLGLTEHVRFLGFVPDETLPLLYRAADLNIVPTLALEGFGLIVVEALAAGTPSMVTPVGGLPEIVAPLAKDLIFASTSVESIAAGLLGVAAGTIELPGEGECRAFARERFSVERMAAQTAEVYREAIEAF